MMTLSDQKRSLVHRLFPTSRSGLATIAENIYSPEKLKEDRDFVIKKLEFTDKEFEEYMKSPPKSHYDFLSYDAFYMILKSVKNVIEKLFRVTPER